MLLLECDSVFTRFCKAIVPVGLTQFNASDDPDVVPRTPAFMISWCFSFPVPC